VIPVTPTATAANPVVNTANVTGGGDPGCPGLTRCGSTTSTPLNSPALTLTKTAAPSPFTVGTAATYTLTLTNNGTAATTAASTITDTIPTGLTIGTLPAGCTAAGQVVTCTVASLTTTAPGNTVSFAIPVTPTAAAGASVTNTASVRGGGDPGCTATTNPLPARCNPSITTTINSPALTITKTASVTGFVVGTPATYTLSVQNTGTAATTAAATVTDTIPTGLTIGTLPAGCTATGQAVSCTIAAGLAVNATTSFVIPVTPTATAANPVVNTANVTGGGDPGCPGLTRCGSTTSTPLQAVDMTSAISALPIAAAPGASVTGTLTCTNTNSTSTAADGVTCTASGGGATVSNCRINNTGTVVTAPFTVPANGNVTCTVTATAPATGTLALSSNTTTTTQETNTTNNTGSGSVPVIDAINDTAQTITSSASAQVVPGGSVLTSGGNDTIGGVAATTSNVTIQSTLTVTSPTAGATLTGWTINTTTGDITAPANVVAAVYTVQYQICSNPAATPVACDSATRQVTVNSNVPPDLTPTYLYTFVVYPALGTPVTQDILINIAEINGTATSGEVQFTVPRSIGFLYDIPTSGFPATITYDVAGVPTAFPVQNGDWDIVADASGFTLTLKAGRSIAANSNSYVYLRSTSNLPGARANLTATIKPGSGGETRTNNNSVVLRQSIQR
jgi:large repetitive protein